MGIVDTLANAYSWTRDYILDEIFLDEAFEYIKQINIRRLDDALLSLSIIENPHRKKPDEFRKRLEFELNKIKSNRIIKAGSETPEKGAIEKVKGLFGQK